MIERLKVYVMTGVSEPSKSVRVMKMRPRLRADVDLVELGNGRTLAVSGGKILGLDSGQMRILAPLLDGNHRMPEIWRGTRGALTPAAVAQTVMMLEALDLVRDGPISAPEAEAAFLDSVAAAPLDSVPVMMIGLSEPLSRMSANALDQLADGWHRVEPDAYTPSDETEAPLLVITSDYLADEIREVNNRMHERNRPWAIVKPFTEEVWVGPIFGRNKEAACWECLAQRLRGHRILEKYAELETGRRLSVGVKESGISASVSFALSAVLLRMASSGEHDELLSVRLPDLEPHRHIVTRRPQCPTCGDLPVAPCSFDLVSYPRPRDLSGKPAKRVKSLEETRKALERHISPYSGVITKLTPISSDSDLYFSAAAGHDFAPSRTDFSLLMKTLKGSLSGGKGRSPLQAEVSALCEAVERGLTMFTGDEPVVKGSYRDVGSSAIELSLLLGFSENQYANRQLLNEENLSKYAFVPNRIDPDAVIDWCWVKDLGDGPSKLVPACYCYYGHPDLYSRCYCLADSNGSAAGGVLEEAIVSGFTELIERDSVGIWWYNRLRYPGLDLDSIDDAYLAALRKDHNKNGREIWGLDLTNDSGVPCFALFSARLGDSPEDIIISFGCDLDPKDAFDAALDELNQFLPWVAKGEDGVTRYWGLEPEAIDWFKNASIASEPYLLPSETLPPTRLDGIASLRTDDCQKDVLVCREIAERLGSRMYAMNLSRPEVDVAVARVIVPGLCHFWRRLGPRRLYEVPVAMGRLPEAQSEEDLNPRTVYF